MTFKQLETELKELVEKHKKLLPEKFNLPSNENNFLERLAYIDKNESFNNELKDLKEKFINEHGINDISEKQAFIYMIGFYKRNLEYGFNSPADIDSYQLIFGNQNR